MEMASSKLAAPVESLVVTNAAISVQGSPAQRATFAELIGGRRFERTISGKATPKSPSAYSVVGKPIPRAELPAKMTGRHTYMRDVRVDGMLHGRVIRPTALGAKLLGVDDSGLRGIATARVVIVYWPGGSRSAGIVKRP